jgi:hypothetical protein
MTITFILVVALALIGLYGFWLAGKFGIGPLQPRSRSRRAVRPDAAPGDIGGRRRHAG